MEMYPWGVDTFWKSKDAKAPYPHQTRLLMSCKCGQRYWNQKNLGYIGARSIFHFPIGCAWLQAQFEDKAECSCPQSDLVVDEELMEHMAHCDECNSR